MGRAVSSLSYELREKSVQGEYLAAKAAQKSYVRRKYARYQGKRIVEHEELRQEIHARIRDDQSPEAIAGHVRRQGVLPFISKESIYRYVASPYGRRLETYRWMRRRRRRGGRVSVKSLPGRVFLDRRPKRINERGRVGDAEGDFVVSGRSGKGVLLVVVDRKTRTVFLELVLAVSISAVHEAFLRIKKRFPEIATLTLDNDLLFAKHAELASLLGIRIYFCHPYHSWEKGSVENANKCLRRDIPKGSDISGYSKGFVQKLEAKLNRRPMRVLGYATPEEMLTAHRKKVKNKKSPS